VAHKDAGEIRTPNEALGLVPFTSGLALFVMAAWGGTVPWTCVRVVMNWAK
jgi:hypothetical protein